MKLKRLLWILPVLLLAGCLSAASIASYLPIFEAALNGVLALVKPSASAAAQADEAKINAAVTDLVAAVQGIKGSLSVSAALGVVESSATQLESDLGVSTNKDVQLATAILDLAIGTYQAIIQKNSVVAWMFDDTVYAQAKKPRAFATSTGDFKRKYNALVKNGGHPEMQMKLSMAEHLHIR